MKPFHFPFVSIGHFTVAWAFFESRIDLATLTIHHKLGGKDVKKPPDRQISKKINYLEDMASKCPKLKPYKKRLLDIVKLARAELDMRHNIIHGFAGFKDSPSKITFTRFKRAFPFEQIRDSYSSRAIFVAAGRIGKISTELDDLFKEIDPRKGKKNSVD